LAPNNTQAPTQAPTEAPTQEPTQAPTEVPTEEPTRPPIGQSPEQDKNAAQEQIEASNWMRKLLVQKGLEEVEANPWFGTGNVVYFYRLGENNIVRQSSHNFLIEAIICYGLVGLAMIAALFVTLLIEAKLFAKRVLRRWNDVVTLLLTMAFFFAFGMVQPTVFDVLMCPLFLMIVMACCNELTEN
jgi:O-antigen ligase